VFREGDSLLKVGVIMAALATALVIAAVVVSVIIGSDSGRVVAAEVAKKALGQLPAYSSTAEEGSANRDSSKEDDSPPHSGAGKARAKSSSEDERSSARKGSSVEEEKLGYSSSRGSEGQQQGQEAKEQLASGGSSPTAPQEVPQPQSAPKPGGDLPLGSQPEPNSTAGLGAQGQPQGHPEPTRAGQQTLPGAEGTDWARPTDEEIEAANEPRHFGLVPGAIMSLTIQKIGIYNAPVFDSESSWALANGIAHVPETSLPWSDTPQRNVYLAGHRMGYRGTWSRMLFYNLDELGEGDKVVLKDRAGHVYEYRVSEVFLAEPTDSWVMGEVKGRDMLTLQTCTPIPTFEKRLIVRADRL